MVGLFCVAGSWTWLAGPSAVIPFAVLPFTKPGEDVLFEDRFVEVAEAFTFELPSVVKELEGSELSASGTSSQHILQTVRRMRHRTLIQVG